MQLEVISRQPTGKAKPTPLLFVHGAWHAAWCWEEHFLPYFTAHGYATHALSLRGHGGSAGREHIRWYSIKQYVNDVVRIASTLPTPPVVIGHSMGGLVVQKYLEKHDAPAGVLLASLPTRGALPFFVRHSLRHPLAALKTVLTFNSLHFVGPARIAHRTFFSADMPRETVAGYAERLQPESMRILLDTIILRLPRPKRVKTPLLVLGAAHDRCFAVGEVKATARAYGTEAEIFPDMGHDMMLDRGWQAVADRILEWLNIQDL
jgi:pimeloyl-ACP methyl ester carboxylesterase